MGQTLFAAAVGVVPALVWWIPFFDGRPFWFVVACASGWGLLAGAVLHLAVRRGHLRDLREFFEAFKAK